MNTKLINKTLQHTQTVDSKYLVVFGFNITRTVEKLGIWRKQFLNFSSLYHCAMLRRSLSLSCNKSIE